MSLIHEVKDIFKKRSGLTSCHKSWEIVELKNVVRIQNGYAFKSNLFNSENKGFPLIRIRDILKGATETYFDGEFPKEYVVHNGDLLIGMDGDFNSDLWKGEEALLNQRVCRIIPNENYILKKFIAYGIDGYLSSINDNTSSTTVKHLSSKSIGEIPFPLPPLPEQNRIVEKLDVLFGHLEQIKSHLEKVPVLLKNFRQAVLNQAVTGKLTEEWRSGRELEEWKLELAQECCEKVQSGGTPKKEGFAETGIPFLKVYNIVDNRIDFNYRPQYVTGEAQNGKIKKSITYPGDVLMNIVGPPLNKIAIIPDDFKEWNLNQAITLFRTKKYLNNKYLYYFFCEGKSVRDVMGDTRGVVGQVNISLTQCRNFEIPIPSLEEQQEIVNRVESQKRPSISGLSFLNSSVSILLIHHKN